MKQGEIFEVLNRSKPSVRLVPADLRKILKWEDHLSTAPRFSPQSAHTMELGGQTLVILHVACAVHLAPNWFVTFDTASMLLRQEWGSVEQQRDILRDQYE